MKPSPISPTSFFRTFHGTHRASTSRAFARAGSYDRLCALLPASGSVLDLACGDDAPIRARVGDRVIGVDLVASPAGVQGRAQQLPFADRVFDAAICHLAFMLFDDIEHVVAELARVLRPGAPFFALVGGGPTADGDDAFHAFARQLTRMRGERRVADGIVADAVINADDRVPAFGDRRASSEAGWRELFRADSGWRDIAFDRWPLDLSGTFDEVWSFLASSYQLADVADERIAAIRAELRSAFPGERVPCTVATYLARVTR